MRKRPYLNLITFFTLYLFVTSIPKSVLNPHFLASGLNFNILFFGTALLFLSQVVVLLTFRNLSSRLSWRIAIILFIAGIFSVIRIESIWQYLIYSVLSGFALYFFWVFYNIAHFELTSQENTGKSSALMFSVGPIVSIFVPAITGYMAQVNVGLIWGSSILFALLILFFVNRQSNFVINYSVSNALKAIEKVRLFIFLEGIWGAVVFAIIPIYTLFFIKTPLNYGIFLSYLAIISVFANFILGHISDKKQKRAVFLYPITIILAILTFLFVFATENLPLWILITGIMSFMLPAFGTLTISLFIDNQNDLGLSFPGRELTLAVGRAAGILFTFVMFVAGLRNLLFVMLGLVMLTYPLVLFYRTKISKKFSYI